jgi:tRNA uridine 5-carboxymethylaminomethyl modification enzyme
VEQFDVIVVGGGHAGCEAALAAGRMGARTAIVTMRAGEFGVMSCNPAIGGLGKGHLVREIDALDGAMGRVADVAGIQFRLLNRRKGPAVQGPRAQADRQIYRERMSAEIAAAPNVHPIYAEVVDLIVEGDTIGGVILRDGFKVRATSTILTSGTFLRGVIHLGEETRSGGREGDAASVRLAERVDTLGLPLARLKTGTPPRLVSKTINWDVLERQPGDDTPTFFSFLTKVTETPQISCGITHTNAQTHDIIRDNIHRSAMYSGKISGNGPRYCPSIEDKVVRFADKASHQIFLEPEGLTSDLVYPNGISTSLPVEVQEAYVRSIVGLETAEIAQYGYAIEYDYVDPRALDRGLKVAALRGLYLAGQINGTTGYEEAAAQGLVAGINAARAVRGEESFAFSRTDSYIGVMIDDLVSHGVTEPYRMFTSRAEYRLTVRVDNADQRLTPTGRDLGCVTDARQAVFLRKRECLEKMQKDLEARSFTSKDLASADVPVAQDGARRTGMDVLALSFVDEAVAQELFHIGTEDEETLRQLKREATYKSYADRQAREIDELQQQEALRLDAQIDYARIPGVSGELARKLSERRPGTIAEARRIEGMTPACLLRLIGFVKQQERKTRVAR